MANTVLNIYEIQNIGKGIITSIVPDNLLLLTPSNPIPGIQAVLDIQQHITHFSRIQVDTGGNFFVYNTDGYGGYLGINPDTGIGAGFPTSSLGICDGFAFTLTSLDFYHDKTLFKDDISSKGIEYADDYETNFTERSLVTKQFVENLISSTNSLQVTTVTINSLSLNTGYNVATGIPNGSTLISVTPFLECISDINGYVIGDRINVSGSQANDVGGLTDSGIGIKYKTNVPTEIVLTINNSIDINIIYSGIVGTSGAIGDPIRYNSLTNWAIKLVILYI